MKLKILESENSKTLQDLLNEYKSAYSGNIRDELFNTRDTISLDPNYLLNLTSYDSSFYKNKLTRLLSSRENTLYYSVLNDTLSGKSPSMKLDPVQLRETYELSGKGLVSKFSVLDGFHRILLCRELGIKVPVIIINIENFVKNDENKVTKYYADDDYDY